MGSDFISVAEAAARAGKEGFLQNVKKAVIPRLIEQGVLQGKKEKNTELVADDESLARVMQLGVDSFTYNQQGYSFLVVHAPIEEVAAKLKTRPCVGEYEEIAKPLK